jgi:TPR repeat protein
MYLRGQGIPADPARAAELFAEGSKKGHAESMLHYARSLESGIGLQADAAGAARWYHEAARLGNAEAAAWSLRHGATP